MANYMKDVANLLGVELDKEFEVEVGSNIVKAKITDKDLYVLCSPPYYSYNAAALLRGLLRGDYIIHTS